MVYEYECPQCGRHFDVVKSVKHMADPESCEKCHVQAIKLFVPQRTHFIGTSVQHAEYNPGLGCIVRNKDHRKEICKAKGVEEIGSEPVDQLHKHYDKKREDARDQSYDKATAGWVGDGSQ